MAKECVLPACILASSVVPEAILLMRSAHRPCNFNVLLVPGVVYSWGSAMSDRLSALDCRYLTCFCVGDTMVGETNTQIVEYLSWCTKVMMSGRFPAKDFSNNAWPENSWRASMAGEPIAGPYTAFFSGVTHDNKARYQTHKFENFYNTKYVCEQCPACSHLHPLSYGDSRPGANWRRYILKHGDYLARTPLEKLTPWLAMPGFSLSRALFDYMHCYHLGIGRDCCGQWIWDLIRFGYSGRGSVDEQLKRLWGDFRLWCKMRRIPTSRRRWRVRTLFRDKIGTGYPELDSRTKAAHVKPIVHFLAHRLRLAAESPTKGDDQAQLRAWSAFGLADMTFTFDTAGFKCTRFHPPRYCKLFKLAHQKSSLLEVLDAAKVCREGPPRVLKSSLSETT